MDITRVLIIICFAHCVEQMSISGSSKENDGRSPQLIPISGSAGHNQPHPVHQYLNNPPPLGQSYTNQPHFGQGLNNQLPLGQPHSNQQHFGQGVNAQPSLGQSPNNQLPLGQNPSNQAPLGQSHSNQPHSGQSFNNQPPFGQAHGNQPHLGSGLSNQAPLGQSHSNQPHSGQSLNNQPLSGQGHSNQQHFGQAHGNQQHFGQAHGNQPHAGSGLSNQAPLGQPHSNQLHLGPGLNNQPPQAQTNHHPGQGALNQPHFGQSLSNQPHFGSAFTNQPSNYQVGRPTPGKMMTRFSSGPELPIPDRSVVEQGPFYQGEEAQATTPESSLPIPIPDTKNGDSNPKFDAPKNGPMNEYGTESVYPTEFPKSSGNSYKYGMSPQKFDSHASLEPMGSTGLPGFTKYMYEKNEKPYVDIESSMVKNDKSYGSVHKFVGNTGTIDAFRQAHTKPTSNSSDMSTKSTEHFVSKSSTIDITGWYNKHTSVTHGKTGKEEHSSTKIPSTMAMDHSKHDHKGTERISTVSNNGSTDTESK